MIRKPMTKIQKILFENQDLKYRDFHSKLMPTVEKEKIIGVRIPILRSLAKDLYKNEPELVKEFLEKSSENHPHEFYEENNLHAFFLEQIKDFDECINLTPKGCKLSYDERPMGARLLIPRSKEKCMQLYNMEACTADWEKHQEVLRKLYRYFEKKQRKKKFLDFVHL